jgi:hypothetical protein
VTTQWAPDDDDDDGPVGESLQQPQPDSDYEPDPAEEDLSIRLSDSDEQFDRAERCSGAAVNAILKLYSVAPISTTSTDIYIYIFWSL